MGPQRERDRHQQPEQRRRPLTAGRRLPERRHRAHGHLLLHDHRAQLRPRQQQQQDPADDATRPFGTGHRDLRRAQRHRGGQQGHPPWSVGDPRRRLPRLRSAAADRPLPGGNPRRIRAGQLRLQRLRQPDLQQRPLAERLLRQPDERRPRRAVGRGANGKEQLLVRQQAPERKRSHHRPLESADPPRQGAVRAAPNRGEQRRPRRAGGLRHAGARLRSQHALPDSWAGRHPQAAAPAVDAESLRRRSGQPVVPEQRQWARRR